jgi:hypothetical protein
MGVGMVKTQESGVVELEEGREGEEAEQREERGEIFFYY